MVFVQLMSMISSYSVQSVVVFAAVFLATIVWLRRPKNLPPGPTRWPIIGNFFDLRKDAVHRILTGWSEKYGSVVSFGMGPQLSIALNDISSVQEALLKQADVFSDRRLSAGSGVFPPKGSFVSSNGEAWKQLRRFGMSAMRSLGVGKRGMQHHINEESCHLLASFDHEGGKPFDPNHIIQNAVSNIICTISFGDRYEYSDPSFRKLSGAVKTLFSTGSLILVSRLVPFMIYTPMYKNRLKMITDIQTFIRQIVQDHQDKFDENDIRDFIDMYILEIRQHGEKGGGNLGNVENALCDETVWRGVADLFLAGTDTTSNSMMWLILYMSMYPDIQQRVQQELDDVIGCDRQPVWDDRNKMPYTNAVLMETQRVKPIAPTSVPHMTNSDTELLGYTIPAKTTVLVNIWAILHDPKYWKDPEKYDPSRFLSEDGKTVEKPESFIPFGFGRRVCLGESLAKMEMFLFLVNLLQRFSFSLPADRPRPSLGGISGFTLGPHPFEIVASKR